MRRQKKSTKQSHTAREKERLLERDKEEIRLRGEYQDNQLALKELKGTTNESTLDDTYAPLADHYYSKIIHGIRSEEEYARRGLTRWDDEHPKELSGTYVDFWGLETAFQYHYLVAFKLDCPEAFQELKELIERFPSDLAANPIWMQYKSRGEMPGPLPDFLSDVFEPAYPPGNEIETAFTRLCLEIYEWMKRYFLEKRWVLDYVFESLEVLRDIHSIAEFTLPDLQRAETSMDPFSFRYEPWDPTQESGDDYAPGLVDAFDQALKQYFHQCHQQLNRAIEREHGRNKPRGRNVEVEHLRWLVRWNAGDTNSQIAKVFGRSPYTIRTAIENLGATDYDLPIRTGKSRPPYMNDCLAQIRPQGNRG